MSEVHVATPVSLTGNLQRPGAIPPEDDLGDIAGLLPRSCGNLDMETSRDRPQGYCRVWTSIFRAVGNERTTRSFFAKRYLVAITRRSSGAQHSRHCGNGGVRKTGPVANGLKPYIPSSFITLGIRPFFDRNRTSWPSNEQNEGQSKRRCSRAPGFRSRSRSIDGSMELERNDRTIEVKMACARWDRTNRWTGRGR